MLEGTPKRQEADHIYSVNVTSAALLTDKLAPVLEKSKSPKVIFMSSFVGSIQRLSEMKSPPPSFVYYASSKAAVNFISVVSAPQTLRRRKQRLSY